MINKLVLSVFPGIDLLGKGFEGQDFCVVRGPDPMTGGDIRSFHPPKACFGGVIGGPPCQDFSLLNRRPGKNSSHMLDEYVRVVTEALPEWFLFENVAAAPDFEIEGYTQQRFELDLGWFSEFSRLRHFVFGSRSGVLLNPVKGTKSNVRGTAVTGSDPRSFRACCDIQGLPSDFDLPFFSLEGKKQAVANGVPLMLSRYLAELIIRDVYDAKPLHQKPLESRRCACPCRRVVVGRAKHFSVACRKRTQRQRARNAEKAKAELS